MASTPTSITTMAISPTILGWRSVKDFTWRSPPSMV
jgi:hypothetical protein